MNNKQNNRCNKITQEDNAKIIALIKSKINPFHTKTNYFPKLNNETKFVRSHRALFRRKKKEQQIVNPKELKHFNLKNREPQNEIIDRAKTYIEEKRKTLMIVEPEVKIDLSEYIKLFNKGEEEKEKKMMEQFLKMKRQSLNFMTYDNQSYKLSPTNIDEFPRMNEEEEKEMNAKIRRRINHKKIIALYKNR